MKTIKFSVPAISCGHCIRTIESEMSELEGISRVHADLDSKTVEIDFELPATQEDIATALQELNYPPELVA